MSEPKNSGEQDKPLEDDESPEVIAHDAEEDPWCGVYSCGSLAPPIVGH
jgi:hypothetical protein